MLLLALAISQQATLTPTQPRCESLVDPIGVDSPMPRLSWKVEATREGLFDLKQTAYRIIVATDPKQLAKEQADLWDSGVVRSSETNNIEYAGKSLGSGKAGYWKVQVWDQSGQASNWSATATWSQGLAKEDWKAKWIGLDIPRVKENDLILPAPRFIRHQFTLKPHIKRAVLYGSALGLIEMHVNGKKVSNDLFMPGWTDYVKRVYTRGYDVTKRLKSGNNVVGVVLGDGWYTGYVGFDRHRDHYGTKPRALVQLQVEYADGTTETIASDENWRARTGPILGSDFLQGEDYDARMELQNWSKPSKTEADWKPVDVGAELNPALESFPGQPVREYAILKAKEVTEPKKGVYVLNLGQNMAGFARLKVQGEKGQKITLRFAERLSPDGNVYTTNLRSARATDSYICKGDGIETWQPRFTFHGFQYIEVTGMNHPPSADEVVGVAITSENANVGAIKTSDRMLNKLVSNARWTQEMNFVDIPTDCPQRDERLGWTGDAQAYIRTACMLTDAQAFYTKWCVALEDGQRSDGQFPMVAPLKVAGGDGGPAWADAGVICPWTVYDVYGDKRLLATHYPSMKKFVEFTRNRSTADLLPPKEFHCFGDWLNINDDTAHEVIFEAYFAYSSHLVARAAAALGHAEEAAHYQRLSDQVKAQFVKAYVADDGSVGYGDKKESQCGEVLALGFDLVDGELANKVAHQLVANIERRGWHLSTGFVGTRDIMRVLSKIGRQDVAFRLLHNTTFPSWGFTIVNGATSIWERWDGWTPEKGFQDPGMNSFAHYAFGAVVGWVMDQPAGIGNLKPGFAVIKVAPQIDPKLSWMKASYDSIRGPIASEWNVEGGKLSMHVIIPANTEAEIHVPTTSETQAVKCFQGMTPVARNGKFAAYRVGSGTYDFETTAPKK